MTDVNTALDGNQNALNDLITAAEASGTTWTTPRGPGKWSPSQVVEHVALSLEEGANVVAGKTSKFPIFPRLIRPIFRVLFFNRVLKRDEFIKAKTFKAFDPLEGPESPTGARSRLEGALEKFDEQCRACAADGRAVPTTTFGRVSVGDYAKFQELHTRHHRKQIPDAR